MTMSNNSFAWYLWHSREEQFLFYFPQIIWIVWRSQDGCCPCSLILQSKLSESCCRLLTRPRSSDSPPPHAHLFCLLLTFLFSLRRRNCWFGEFCYLLSFTCYIRKFYSIDRMVSIWRCQITEDKIRFWLLMDSFFHLNSFNWLDIFLWISHLIW